MLIGLTKDKMSGSLPDIPIIDGYIIAGGSIRRWFMGEKQDSDFDYFSIGENKLSSEWPIIADHKMAITYDYKGLKLQFIKREYEDIASVLQSFDFHHCQFAYDGTMIYTTSDALIATPRKHLSFNVAQEGFELDTLRRAFKYQRQGYTPCLGTLSKLAQMFIDKTKQQLQDMTEISPSGGKRRIIRFD